MPGLGWHTPVLTKQTIMKPNQVISGMDMKLEKLIDSYFHDSSPIHLRKYYIYGNGVYIFLTITLLIISRFMAAEIFEQYCLVGLAFFIVMTFAFLFVRNIEHIIAFTKIGMELIIFYFMYRMGGILSSGGLVIVGIAPILYALILKKYKWMVSIFSLYFISVCVLYFLDDQLTGKDLLTANQNLTFFIIILLGITSYIFAFALYAQRIYTNLERKETLRQKEINDAKTSLFTNITHEFRTPLTIILGLADTLKTNLNEFVSDHAHSISENGKHLLQMVDHMLDFSKIESGNLQINNVQGNIITFLHYLFQLHEYHAGEKNIQFIFEPESQAYQVNYDPEKLTTIITNLLSNAVKFTPNGGKITMKVKRIKHDLCLQVIDNGIGIPEDKQLKIFDRFYQVDSSNTRRTGGAGIGLALTKELVLLLKGTITVESNSGQGATFTVTLPQLCNVQNNHDQKDLTHNYLDLVDEKITEKINPTHESQHKKPRLLIVEDNLDMISYLKSCYQSIYSIETKTDGKEGIDQAIKTIPDIIISDIMMPQMDGYTLCKTLKTDFRTSHIPIILLTAKADMPSRIQGLHEGADAYIVKPFNQQELLVRMNKLLDLRRTLFIRYSKGDFLNNTTDPILKREDTFMKKVTDHIEEHLHNNQYDVPSLCTGMIMSKSQLYRKFKALTNMSAAKYIRKLRLQKAKLLLETSTMNITEVSEKVGFKTLSTFSELFKIEFGKTPSEFLKDIESESPIRVH